MFTLGLFQVCLTVLLRNLGDKTRQDDIIPRWQPNPSHHPGSSIAFKDIFLDGILRACSAGTVPFRSPIQSDSFWPFRNGRTTILICDVVAKRNSWPAFRSCRTGPNFYHFWFLIFGFYDSGVGRGVLWPWLKFFPFINIIMQYMLLIFY